MSLLLDRQTEVEIAWNLHHSGRGRHFQKRRLQINVFHRLCGEQNWRCCYCGSRMEGFAQDSDAPTIEHIIPLSLGGPDRIENIVVACYRCNTDRGSAITDIHIAAIDAWEGWDDANDRRAA